MIINSSGKFHLPRKSEMIAISRLKGTSGLQMIEKVYPKASELSEILNYNPCPECSEVFHNPPNLEMHLQKCHRRETHHPPPRESNIVKQFYCPESGCKYSGGHSKEFGMKFFTQHKYLKQHYIKVHMEKKFICEQCGKGFATIQQRRRHLDECGLKFMCSCGAEYSTIPALLTHASRKQHTFIKSWTAIRSRKTEKNENPTAVKPILPKPVVCDNIVANTVVALSELSCVKSVDVGIQTEAPTGHRRRRNTSRVLDTRQTQTGEKRTRISSETQTIGEYCIKSKKSVVRRRKKSMETQTKLVEYTMNTVGNGSCFSIGRDIGLPQLWFSSATQTSTGAPFDDSLPPLGSLFEEDIKKPDEQTNLFSDITIDSSDQFLSVFMSKDDLVDDGKSCSIETQTEFSFESLFENYTDSLTNIETQTSHDLWDQYSNTCTQTCDDILLAFSDIETQTVWPDVSTETQTLHY